MYHVARGGLNAAWFETIGWRPESDLVV